MPAVKHEALMLLHTGTDGQLQPKLKFTRGAHKDKLQEWTILHMGALKLQRFCRASTPSATAPE